MGRNWVESKYFGIKVPSVSAHATTYWRLEAEDTERECNQQRYGPEGHFDQSDNEDEAPDFVKQSVSNRCCCLHQLGVIAL